jgi:hypothetical protein
MMTVVPLMKSRLLISDISTSSTMSLLPCVAPRSPGNFCREKGLQFRLLRTAKFTKLDFGFFFQSKQDVYALMRQAVK